MERTACELTRRRSIGGEFYVKQGYRNALWDLGTQKAIAVILIVYVCVCVCAWLWVYVCVCDCVVWLDVFVFMPCVPVLPDCIRECS